ncbi:MAG: NUDIX hydrolase [Candidatus Bathyarchaeia archaeon]
MAVDETRREYPSHPLVGVGVVIREGDKILLIRRGVNPGKGRWSIPGGLVELGEEVREAAKREVEEETGLRVEVDRLLEVFDRVGYDDDGRVRFHWFIIDFLAHPVGGDLRLTPEVMEARWVKIDEVDAYPVTEALKALVKRLS